MCCWPDAPSVELIRRLPPYTTLPRSLRAPEMKRKFGSSQTCVSYVTKLTVPEEWHRRRITEQTLDCSGVKPVVDPGHNFAESIGPSAPRIRKFGGSETAAVPREKRHRNETEKLVDCFLWGLPEKPAGRIIPLVNNLPSAAAAVGPKRFKRLESLAAAAVDRRKVKLIEPWVPAALEPLKPKVKRLRIKFDGKEIFRYVEKETWRQRLENFNEFREKVRDRDENLHRTFQKILKIYRTGHKSVEETYFLVSELFAEHYDLLEEFGWECTSFLTPVVKRDNSQD